MVDVANHAVCPTCGHTRVYLRSGEQLLWLVCRACGEVGVISQAHTAHEDKAAVQVWSDVETELQRWQYDPARDTANFAAPHPPRETPMQKILDEIAAERTRQICEEGWTPEHDDRHDRGELSAAAAAYAVAGVQAPGYFFDPEKNAFDPLDEVAESLFPREWDDSWFKPGERRRNLIKAAALIVAELERLDRAAPTPAPHVGGDGLAAL